MSSEQIDKDIRDFLVNNDLYVLSKTLYNRLIGYDFKLNCKFQNQGYAIVNGNYELEQLRSEVRNQND